MKTIRVLSAALLITLIFAGCTTRNNNTTVPPVVSTPSAVAPANPVNPVNPGVSSNIDGFRSGIERDSSWLEDEASRLYDNYASSRYEYETEGSSIYLPYTNSEASDISAAAAMSTDFSQIGALDAKKLGWGPGGPTDAKKRPEGATTYQTKYGQYGAYFIAPDKNKIYLTFDEGYENGYTSAILDTLRDKNVKAVFFITYPYAKDERELVTRMVNEGHVLGNHSTKHLSFPDMPLTEAAKDIQTLHDYVKAQYGYEMSLFRPPMGEFNEQVLALAQSMNYKSVFWSFAYRDWLTDDQPLTIDATNAITGKCHPGAIYLLHAVSKTNSEILGDVIDMLRAQGYEFSKWDIY